MEAKEAAASLEILMSGFTSRISELQELLIARNMCVGKVTPGLSSIDACVKAMEFQVQSIKNRIKEEKEAIPKARKLVDLAMNQQKKLQHMLSVLPACVVDAAASAANCNESDSAKDKSDGEFVRTEKAEDPIASQKEKRGRGQVTRWFISSEDLDSLSSYMRGRLTLEKINSAINEMAIYAESNAQLVTAPRKKLSEDLLEKALELRDIASSDQVKGRHFFLENDMKGPGLKLDNTGKAILTVLRHLGRIQETRIGHHRVLILAKPQ